MSFFGTMKAVGSTVAVKTAPARAYLGDLAELEAAHQRSAVGVVESFFTPAGVRASRAAGRVASTVVMDLIEAATVQGTKGARSARAARARRAKVSRPAARRRVS